MPTGTLDLVNTRRKFVRVIPANPDLGDAIFGSITALGQLEPPVDVEFDLVTRKSGKVVATRIRPLGREGDACP
jgi:hypothetical protein